MSEMLSSFREKAFLGEAIRNEKLINQIDLTAKKVNSILNPIDDIAKKKVVGESMKLVEGLAEQGEWKTDNVASLLAAEKDKNRPANQEVAGERLDVLGKGVFVAMRYGGNEELKDVLGTGSAVEIDNLLPGPLKGLGERVRSNIIEDENILKILDDLDKTRRVTSGSGKTGEKKLEGKISEALDKLLDMEADEEELSMVVAYLGAEMEMRGEGDEGKTVQTRKRQEGLIDIDIVGKKKRHPVDGEYFGSQEGPLGRAPVIELPENMKEKAENIDSLESAKNWLTRTFVEMSEKPIFFANWWQGDIVDNAVGLLAERLGLSSFSPEIGDLKKYAYATFSVLGMQAVDRNADANSDNYGQFTPPKNMVSELHWDDGGEKYRILLENPIVGSFLKEIKSLAYSNSEGWKIVKAFSDSHSYQHQNEFIKELVDKDSFINSMESKNIGNNIEEILPFGRVALAMFEVDWLPEWIRYGHAIKYDYLKGKSGAKDLAWLKIYADSKDGNPVKKFTWTTKMNSLSPDGKEYEIGHDHPRVARNFDVLVFKGSYVNRKEIVWGLEKVLSPFIEKHLMENGRMVRASKKNILDKYLKFNKAMGEIFGGPQGAELDNLTNMEKTLMALKNYWGDFKGEEDKEVFTNFLVGLFKIKADALFYPGYKSGADIILNNIRSLDPYTGEKDRASALAGALGENANFAHGWVGETRRIYGVDLLETKKVGKELVAKYPDFWNAYVRLFMDTPDINEATTKYRKAVRFLNERVWAAATGGAAEALNIIRK